MPLISPWPGLSHALLHDLEPAAVEMPHVPFLPAFVTSKWQGVCNI